MKKVLPVNYSIDASYVLNLSDYLPSQQTQVALRNRMDIKFCYHINSTYRQHKIYKSVREKLGEKKEENRNKMTVDFIVGCDILSEK